MLFRKKKEQRTYDPAKEKPVLRKSICTGETTAGFTSLADGAFHEVMLIRDDADLAEFRRLYGITGEIEVRY